MRDKKRIKIFLEEFEELWEKVPDWRFGQLISNFFGNFKENCFYIEDDEMLSQIKKFKKQLSRDDEFCEKDKNEEFISCVSGDINGNLTYQFKGKVENIVTGFITGLEKIIREYDLDKEAIIKLWSETHMELNNDER